MAHVEGERAERDRVALLQPAVRRDVARTGDTVFRAGLDQLVEQEPVVLVRAFNGHAEPFLQFRRTAGVVEMAVGQEDLLDLQPDFPDGFLDARHVAARVEHRAGLGLIVEDQGAVLL